VTRVQYIWPFVYSQTKKSMGVKSSDLAGHATGNKQKLKLSLQQAVKAHRVVRCRGSQIL
jgi:hypothetical protein